MRAGERQTARGNSGGLTDRGLQHFQGSDLAQTPGRLPLPLGRRVARDGRVVLRSSRVNSLHTTHGVCSSFC